MPVPLVIMLAAFALIWWVMAFTPFGRYIYASGGNAEASRMLGIPVDRTQVALYVISGVAGALAGVIVAAMLGAAAPNSVGKHLLTVIAAIILGGTSLFGGRGSVWGTLLAVLILGTLNNGLTLLNVLEFLAGRHQGRGTALGRGSRPAARPVAGMTASRIDRSKTERSWTCPSASHSG